MTHSDSATWRNDRATCQTADWHGVCSSIMLLLCLVYGVTSVHNWVGAHLRPIEFVRSRYFGCIEKKTNKKTKKQYREDALTAMGFVLWLNMALIAAGEIKHSIWQPNSRPIGYLDVAEGFLASKPLSFQSPATFKHSLRSPNIRHLSSRTAIHNYCTFLGLQRARCTPHSDIDACMPCADLFN